MYEKNSKMKYQEEKTAVIMGVVLMVTLFTLIVKSDKESPKEVTLDDLPELIVFKECLARQELFRDIEICDCATLAGHIEWCSGDIKY